ncbi:MAG: XRE family transcriptional regulator [Bacillaceae bacterium]|nr:XRE family transcriptional regulator [Bacillaceae bacterium]
MYSKQFGERLRKLRLQKGLTMKELGKIFSLAESTISGYENGTRKPDMDLIARFADFFEVTTDYLYGRTDNPRETVQKKENKNLFFFDIEGLTEEEIEEIKRHIEYVKWKAKQERGKNKNG